MPEQRAESLAPSYLIDSATSRFSVKAYAGGMLSAFGHSPTIAIRSFHGEARFRAEAPEQSTLELVIDASSLVVTSESSEKDRAEIERVMKEEVLETGLFPEIRFTSGPVTAVKISDAMYALRIAGTLSLHGVEGSVVVPCNVVVDDDRLRGSGDFTIRQTDYRIRPVTAAGGTIKVKDELKFTFDIVGARRRL